MGSIDKITSPDIGNFPAAIFEQQGEVPIAQCEETQISDPAPAWSPGNTLYTPSISIANINLIGKTVTIINSTNDDGDWTVLDQAGGVLTLNHTFTAPVSMGTTTIHDTGQAYLTRNVKSFADFIHAAGYAYTIKGGKLYTDCPDGTLSPACSNTWNPGE